MPKKADAPNLLQEVLDMWKAWLSLFASLASGAVCWVLLYQLHVAQVIVVSVAVLATILFVAALALGIRHLRKPKEVEENPLKIHLNRL